MAHQNQADYTKGTIQFDHTPKRAHKSTNSYMNFGITQNIRTEFSSTADFVYYYKIDIT